MTPNDFRTSIFFLIIGFVYMLICIAGTTTMGIFPRALEKTEVTVESSIPREIFDIVFAVDGAIKKRSESQMTGGFHVRLKGGSFPYSVTERILEGPSELIILPFKKKIPTGEVIQSPSSLEEIVTNGKKAFKSFMRKPTLKNAFLVGRKFAFDSELVSQKAEKILDDLNGKYASVSLIGDSIIALFDQESLDVLRKYGDPIKTRISSTGLTLLT